MTVRFQSGSAKLRRSRTYRALKPKIILMIGCGVPYHEIRKTLGVTKSLITYYAQQLGIDKITPTRAVKFENLIEGPFTRVFACVCALSGRKFFHPTWRKFHPDLVSSRDQYAVSCRFRFNVYDYPEHFDLSLIERYGWYCCPGGNKRGTKNLNGVSRDHLLSIAAGWKLGADPKIMSHPANCRLVRHRDNQVKMTKSVITLDELLHKIKNWSANQQA
jgi:hypothetical protein